MKQFNAERAKIMHERRLKTHYMSKYKSEKIISENLRKLLKTEHELHTHKKGLAIGYAEKLKKANIELEMYRKASIIKLIILKLFK